MAETRVLTLHEPSKAFIISLENCNRIVKKWLTVLQMAAMTTVTVLVFEQGLKSFVIFIYFKIHPLPYLHRTI